MKKESFWRGFKSKSFKGMGHTFDPHKFIHKSMPDMVAGRTYRSTLSSAAIGGLGGALIPVKEPERLKGLTGERRSKEMSKMKDEQKKLKGLYDKGRINPFSYSEKMKKLQTPGQTRRSRALALGVIGGGVGNYTGSSGAMNKVREITEKIAPHIRVTKDSFGNRKFLLKDTSGGAGGELGRLVNKFRSQGLSAKDFAKKFHPDRNPNVDESIKKNFGDIYHNLKGGDKSSAGLAFKDFESVMDMAEKERTNWKPW